jgi:peptidoglycan/xylan/chitin deacetylase (PgdA/CDA1 family)
MGVPVTIYVTSGVVDSEFWLNKRQYKMLLPAISTSDGSRSTDGDSRDQARSQGFEILPGLTLEELKSIDKHKNVIVGSHSVSHQMLPEINNRDCEKEILDSKEQLENMLKHKIDHFAFPYGQFGNREKELVMKAGYTSAAALNDQWISQDSDIFCFPRKGTGPLGSSVPWLQYRIGK